MHQQLAAERAARMRAREVLLAKAARVEQGRRERVAEGHLHGGARRRCEVQRAGFLLDGAFDHPVGVLPERRVGFAGEGDQRHAQALQHRHDDIELVALAGVGNRDHGVAFGDHAEVAVAGLGGVNEHRRRAGRGQRRGDLAPDMAALAHAHHDDTPAAAEDGRNGARKTFAEPSLRAGQRCGFDVERLRGQRQGARRIERPRRQGRRQRRGGLGAGTHGTRGLLGARF